MTYEMYYRVFEAAGILSIASGVISVLLFIFLKIPKIVGYLSGTAEKRAINSIRDAFEKPEGSKAGVFHSGECLQTARIESGTSSETVVLQENPVEEIVVMEEICFISVEKTPTSLKVSNSRFIK